MSSLLASTLEERLERIEARLEEIERALSRLQSSEPGPAELPAPESVSAEGSASLAASILPRAGAVANVLTLVGRSCLVLGGAFLVRSLTDAGAVAPAAGAAIGLAYAVAWILVADRAARRGRAASAAFLAITSVVIAYPLIAETATRFKVFTPPGAAGVLAVLTGLCLAVAWRGDLPALAWAAVLASASTAAVLSLVTGAVEVFAASQLAIGLATAYLAYGRRQWPGLRWLGAIAADALVLWVALRLVSESFAERAPALSQFLLLAFALPFLYIGTFAVRTLARRESATAFDVFESIAALAVGLGGAALVVRNVQDAQPSLGASAVVIGAGCYGVAFVFVERRQGHGRNFFFYATLALLLTLSGTALMAGGAALAILWSALALATSALAARYRRVTLAVHGAVYGAAAAWQSGLAAASTDAFLAPAASRWSLPAGAALWTVAAAAASYILLARARREASRSGGSFARAALATIVAFGGGAFAVDWLRAMVSSAAGSDAGAIAAVRTAVLAAAAILLAALRRRAPLAELAWLAYGILSLGAVKLLLEDLPSGRPATLFLAFALYGAALVAVPRLLRGAAQAAPKSFSG